MLYIIWIIISAMILGIGIDVGRAYLIVPGIVSVVMSVVVTIATWIEHEMN